VSRVTSRVTPAPTLPQATPATDRQWDLRSVVGVNVSIVVTNSRAVQRGAFLFPLHRSRIAGFAVAVDRRLQITAENRFAAPVSCSRVLWACRRRDGAGRP
jgi:hypothetical protein